MPRPRTCPHCMKPMPIKNGYKFDDDMNLICGKCGEVAFPANKDAETKLIGKKRTGVTGANATSWEHHHKQSYYGYTPGRTANNIPKPGGTVSSGYNPGDY